MQIRTGPRRFAEEIVVRCGFGLMLGFVQLRAGFAENTVRFYGDGGLQKKTRTACE